VLESCEKLNIADTTLPPVISIGVLLVLLLHRIFLHVSDGVYKLLLSLHLRACECRLEVTIVVLFTVTRR
jgi:hypothetical protein